MFYKRIFSPQKSTAHLEGSNGKAVVLFVTVFGEEIFNKLK